MRERAELQEVAHLERMVDIERTRLEANQRRLVAAQSAPMADWGGYSPRAQAHAEWHDANERANRALMPPVRLSGLQTVPEGGGTPTYLYLSEPDDADVVRGALALFDAFADGQLAESIYAGRSFGMSLGVSGARTLYLMGMEGEGELRMTLEASGGGVSDVNPLFGPHDGWATEHEIVAAHDDVGV